LKRLIVITGATACGKTAVSVQLAQMLSTDIISCDSRQFYREMSIGTAKPTKEEMKGVTHHFIDSHSISEEINAGKFESLALPLLQQLFKTKDYVILTGGSGLFIDALVNGFDSMPKVSSDIRNELNERHKEFGLEVLAKELQKIDPEYAQIVDIKNPKRVIRALEVFRSSGTKYSELRLGKAEKRDFETVKIVLNHPREVLYQRINIRVDQMIAKNLENEVRKLLPFKHLNAMKTVGYQEFFDYFEGKGSLEQVIELIKRNSRRYAKRQLTWFRRDDSYQWVDATNFDGIVKVATSR
jgi:tRNA dimethylallyltransferase